MKNPDRDLLVRSLVHVRSIIDQASTWILWRLREKEFASWPEDQRAMIQNACVESSLLNIRILNEFFKKEKTKGLIKASHYMGSASPGQFLTGAEERKINDHLAHLTWERPSDDTPRWSEELTFRALERCHLLLGHILKHLLKPSDNEYAPCAQEYEGITQYLARKRG